MAMFEVIGEGEYDPQNDTLSVQPFPMPGTQFAGATVIASGWVTDDRVGVLLLQDAKPFYTVAEHVLGGERLWSQSHENIVPAAASFDEQFGFWGES